jgi:hypothetical protein
LSFRSTTRSANRVPERQALRRHHRFERLRDNSSEAAATPSDYVTRDVEWCEHSARIGVNSGACRHRGRITYSHHRHLFGCADACKADYANAALGQGPTFAWGNALRSLGLPCGLESGDASRAPAKPLLSHEQRPDRACHEGSTAFGDRGCNFVRTKAKE